MPSNTPDFKKYFPNCKVAQVDVPPTNGSDDGAERSPLPVDPLFNVAGVDLRAGTDDKPVADIGPPALGPPRGSLTTRTSFNGLAPSRRVLISLCILGWLAAGIGFSLWLLN
jgi:hypothetical protein